MHLHQGLVAVCALLALALLATFYNVVSGAVSHAAVRRMATSSAAFETSVGRSPSLPKRPSVLVAGAAD